MPNSFRKQLENFDRALKYDDDNHVLLHTSAFCHDDMHTDVALSPAPTWLWAYLERIL
jgi:hypothetical protein